MTLQGCLYDAAEQNNIPLIKHLAATSYLTADHYTHALNLILDPKKKLSLENRHAIALTLCSLGAKPELIPEDGKPALFKAVQFLHQPLFNTLLGYVENQTNIRDNEGNSLLHAAVQVVGDENPRFNFILFLLRLGICIDAKNNQQQTAASLATSKEFSVLSTIEKFFESLGNKETTVDTIIKFLRSLDAFEKDLWRYLRDSEGQCALHLAILYCQPAVVHALLSAGATADLGSKRHDGKTPYDLVAKSAEAFSPTSLLNANFLDQYLRFDIPSFIQLMHQIEVLKEQLRVMQLAHAEQVDASNKDAITITALTDQIVRLSSQAAAMTNDANDSGNLRRQLATAEIALTAEREKTQAFAGKLAEAQEELRQMKEREAKKKEKKAAKKNGTYDQVISELQGAGAGSGTRARSLTASGGGSSSADSVPVVRAGGGKPPSLAAFRNLSAKKLSVSGDDAGDTITKPAGSSSPLISRNGKSNGKK
jgi:ankyrin repeat protein